MKTKAELGDISTSQEIPTIASKLPKADPLIWDLKTQILKSFIIYPTCVSLCMRPEYTVSVCQGMLARELAKQGQVFFEQGRTADTNCS